MILSIVNEKGGSGKSTIAVNLACKFLQEKINVLIVDTDPQQSTKNFINFRKANGIHDDLNSFYQNKQELVKNIEDLKKKYDSIIIDTGGRDNEEMRQAMLLSDILIIPTIPNAFDSNVLLKMINLAKEAKNINNKLKILIVISKASPNPFLYKNINSLKEFIKSCDLHDIELANTIIYERAIYNKSIFEGKSVVEYEDNKAKSDFLNFYDELVILAKK